MNEKKLQKNNAEVDKLIGANLTKFRESRGISRKELAEQFHIQEDSLYRIERGDIGLSCEYCYVLANELHCDMNFIFGTSDVPDFTPRGRGCDESENCSDASLLRKLFGKSVMRQKSAVA